MNTAVVVDKSMHDKNSYEIAEFFGKEHGENITVEEIEIQLEKFKKELLERIGEQ